MKTGLPPGTQGAHSVNATGLTGQSNGPAPQTQRPAAQPTMGGSGWYDMAANMGGRLANTLYALLPQQPPVSAAAQQDPKTGLAKELNSAEAMESFLKTNAAGKIKTSFEGKGKNLVHIAAQYGSPEALQVVLNHVGQMSESERKAVLNQKSTDASLGMTPLNLAAWVPGREGAVELLAHHPDVHVNIPNTSGMTPLMSAEHWSNTKSFETLVGIRNQNADGTVNPDRTVDVNAQDGHGRTVLARAAIEGRSENMQTLLERRSDDIEVNKPDGDNQTAMHHAAGKGKFEAAQLLMSAPGINLEARGHLEATPFISSMAAIAEGGGDIRIANLFLHKDGVDLNAKDAKGGTPLGYYATNPAAFEGLDLSGIDVDVKKGVVSRKVS